MIFGALSVATKPSGNEKVPDRFNQSPPRDVSLLILAQALLWSNRVSKIGAREVPSLRLLACLSPRECVFSASRVTQSSPNKQHTWGTCAQALPFLSSPPKFACSSTIGYTSSRYFSLPCTSAFIRLSPSLSTYKNNTQQQTKLQNDARP